MRSTTPRPRPGQAGFGLVEVLVSATVLVITLLALFSVLDTQVNASAANRNASAAASLAEADQERLRSFRVTDLSNRYETRSVTVAGVTYIVVSDADWIRDETGGTQGCANASKQADYLRLTSTVTGPYVGSGSGKPVTVRSLIAAPLGEFGDKQGTIAVNTIDAAGKPVQGAGVTATGPQVLSDTSNEQGCAVFGYVKPGSYGLAVSAQGFVDKSGSSSATSSVTASPGTVNTVSVSYDRAAAATVSFVTKPLGGTDVAAKAGALSAANPGVPACPSAPASCPTPTPGFRLFAPTQPASAIGATQLFPFTDAYTFYAGSCAANNPATYSPTYFSSHTGSQVMAPGATASLSVRVPALNLRLRSDAATTWRVVATQAVATCPSFRWTFSAPAGDATVPEPGVPFGKYIVCVDNASVRRTTKSAVDLTTDAGSTEQTFDFRSGVAGDQTEAGGTCA